MSWYEFTWKERQFRINTLLRQALDTLIFNIKYNTKGKWDAMVIVSGDRRVGTGKSTMVQLMAAYCAMRLGSDYTLNDLYFDSEDMLKKAINKPDYSINHYDEARRGLATSKRMSKVQEDLLDYYAECRQLHHINFIVLPDFFKLNEEIAVARSEYLINVVRERQEIMTDVVTGVKEPITEWSRGTFHFYRWETKKILFDIYQNTRRKDYWAMNPDFHGDFEDLEVLNKTEYEAKKLEALKTYQVDKEVRASTKRFKVERDMMIQYALKHNMKEQDIADFLGKTQQQINIIRNSTLPNNENAIENEA